ncbi:hypothetical protein [Nevskia sp.]|uniref:hypothetical protein n=1 Tax=Nevskia sp. TaxID=1929292 RepID=UPI003F6E8C96
MLDAGLRRAHRDIEGMRLDHHRVAAQVLRLRRKADCVDPAAEAFQFDAQRDL